MSATKKPRRIPVATRAVLLSALLLASFASAEPTASEWRQDLGYLLATIETVHPDLYARVSRETVAEAAARLSEEIPRLDAAQITVRLMQLVAMVGDGHSSVDPVDPAGFGNWFPVRFYGFRDGVFITAIDKKHGDFVGSRVVRIGQRSAKEAWDRAATLVGADNEFGSLHSAPLYLSNPTALAALGVIEDAERLDLTVDRSGGGRETLTLRAIESEFDLSFQFWGEMWGPASSKVEYVSGFGRKSADHYDTGSDLPLHLRYRSTFWFTYIEPEKLFYVQINSMGDGRDETFHQFLERLWRTVDEAEVEAFVLDIRYNSGGDGSLVMPFVHGIIKRDRLNRYGRLFTIVGRSTFSAAVMLAAAMDQHTETVFVGEPMGAYYKHFGDGTSFQLPNSGLEVWVSTVYHQLDSYAGETALSPIQLPAQFSSRDYFEGRDPALRQIRTAADRPPLAALFRERGAKVALAAYERRQREYGGVPWWEPISMHDLNALGHELAESDRWDDAFAAFHLNARRHPDHWRVWYSLGRAHKERGDIESAIENYEKALAVDPFNNLASYQRQALEELRRVR